MKHIWSVSWDFYISLNILSTNVLRWTYCTSTIERQKYGGYSYCSQYQKRKKQCTDLLKLFLCGYPACYSRDNVCYTCPITGKIKETYFSSLNATHLWSIRDKTCIIIINGIKKSNTLIATVRLGKRQKSEQYTFYTL
jgi:hypothetical protein